jgi:protocatechuate 3,4-dioxygenase beta subunit
MEKHTLDDDRPIGRLLGRREALALLGASGLILLARPIRAATGGAASCVARPRQTAGPFFVEEALDRSDIRSDPATGATSAGTPLRLSFRVSRASAGACAPLPGATVHVWHCDAAGRYSDIGSWGGSTAGQKFLRGYQTTDGAGNAAFTTIYPGWYEGRAVHVHFKIRAPDVAGRQREFTSQLYFDDAISDRVFASGPYPAGGVQRRMRNERDGLFRSGGRELLLDVREETPGYTATFDIGLDIA